MTASRRRVIPIAHSGANLGEAGIAQGQQAGQQGDAGDAKGEDVQRCRYGERPVEDPQRFGLQRRLIQQVAAIQPKFFLQRRNQRRHRGWSNPQAQPRLRDIRKVPGQRREIDGNLAFWVAVIRIDADHFQRPVSARRGDLDPVAEAKLHPPRQLFTDEAGIARAKPNPGLFGRLQQRPVIAIGGVIGETENFNWRPVDLRVGPAARQDGSDFGTLSQPRLDLGGLRII